MRKARFFAHVAVGLTGIAFISVAFVGCKKEKDDAAADSAAPAEPAAPAPAAPDGAPAPAGPSAPPAAQEWAGATPANVANAGAAGCEVKQLREWIRVACGFAGRDSGAPVDINITRQGTREAMKTATGATTLVYPWEAGQNLEAVFSWEKQTRGFTANWPAGSPPPAAVGMFGPPNERRVDQCDTDRDCGVGRQCCLTTSGRGLCNPSGKEVCRSQNLYTKCNTDAECRREQSTKSLCKYDSKVKTKICVWDADGKRDSKDPKEKPKLRIPKNDR